MLKIYYGHIQLLQDNKKFDEWLEQMDATRKEKILRCKDEADKRRSLLAGILLQKAFEKEDSNHEKEDSNRGIYYSISHSGDYVICVLSDRSVGIDIENKYRSIFIDFHKRKIDKIANKCLTTAEMTQFLNNDPMNKIDQFLLFWTRKESYSKAMQKGLAMGFQTIDTQKIDRFFWSDWLKEGYYCSLYVEDANFTDIDFNEILFL